MAPSTALYFPWIDIDDEAWLRTSLLYWDKVSTIVPVSIKKPYASRTARALADAGFLEPLFVASDTPEVEAITPQVTEFLNAQAGVDLLLADAHGGVRMHPDKLAGHLIESVEMHPQKLSDRIQYQLKKHISGDGFTKSPSRWLSVERRFADYYMTLLASRLSARVGASPTTSMDAADRLSMTARLGVHPSRFLRNYPWYPADEPTGRRLRSTRTLPGGVLHGLVAHLTIDQLRVRPDTPVKKLLEFRVSHSDELATFRRKVTELTSAVGQQVSIEALQQTAADMIKNEITPGLSSLKKALAGRGIRAIAEGVVKVAFVSVGSTALLPAIGLSAPVALAVGAGVSLVASAVTYSVERAEALRANPYSYLLSVGSTLG